ncbi:unnamed protein product [Rhodiola kirilowii]
MTESMRRDCDRLFGFLACPPLVCAPDSDQSAVSHSITWRQPLSAKMIDIKGATAFSVPGDCTCLGLSRVHFQEFPDLGLCWCS